MLYMGALSLARVSADHHLARTYRHLVNDRGKEKQEALVAVARKTLVIMRALIITQTRYIDDFATTAS